jgi:hypothetical protein
MFLTSIIGMTVVIVGFIILVLFVILKIKNSKENRRIKVIREQQQREFDELLAKAKLESQREEKIRNEFELNYSEESIQEYILEYEDELEAKKELLKKYANRVKIHSDVDDEPDDEPKVRFSRSKTPKISPYERLRDEYLKKSKYKTFTFEKSESFYQCLVKHLDSKGITEPELYNAAGVQRQTFYKIKSIEGYIPRRRTVFYFVLYLKLNLEEATELLGLAGYQLNPSSKIESYIKFCIQNEMYDIDEINEFLYDTFGEII